MHAIPRTPSTLRLSISFLFITAPPGFRFRKITLLVLYKTVPVTVRVPVYRRAFALSDVVAAEPLSFRRTCSATTILFSLVWKLTQATCVSKVSGARGKSGTVKRPNTENFQPPKNKLVSEQLITHSDNYCLTQSFLTIPIWQKQADKTSSQQHFCS